MMILTKYNENNNLFYSFEAFQRETWNPYRREKTESVVFTLAGAKTYEEKKEALREIAKEAQRLDCGGLGWSEETDIAWWFESNAKRYGLVRELRENGFPV